MFRIFLLPYTSLPIDVEVFHSHPQKMTFMVPVQFIIYDLSGNTRAIKTPTIFFLNTADNLSISVNAGNFSDDKEFHRTVFLLQVYLFLHVPFHIFAARCQMHVV